MDNQARFYSSLPTVFTRDGLAARLSGKQSGFNVDKWLRHAVATQQALQVADTDIYAARQTERTDSSYVIATLLAPDAAIAYHTALDFVGEIPFLFLDPVLCLHEPQASLCLSRPRVHRRPLSLYPSKQRPDAMGREGL